MSIANLKALLKDERVPAVAARVSIHDGEDKHWRVNEENDYIVTATTLQHGVPIDVNWSFPPGQYSLPQVNDEILVGFDDGEFEGEAYLIGRTSSGVPAPDGEAGELSPGQFWVIGDRAELRQSTKVLLKSPLVEAKNSGPTEPTLKGNTYRSAEDTMLSSLSALAVALGVYATAIKTIADPTNAATPALLTATGNLAAAIAAFQAGAATYLTTVFKAE